MLLSKIKKTQTVIFFNITSCFFRCNICDKKYIDKYLLKVHMRHHDPSFQRFKCDKCPKTFIKQFSLLNHMRYGHSTESDKNIACDICNKK